MQLIVVKFLVQICFLFTAVSFLLHNLPPHLKPPTMPTTTPPTLLVILVPCCSNLVRRPLLHCVSHFTTRTGANPNVTDAAGCTLLHVGVEKMSKYLHLPDARNHSKKIGSLFACLRVVLEAVTSTAHTHAKSGSARSATDLVDQRNEKGLPALHMAAALPNNVHALQVVLLTHGADPLLVNSSGFTAEMIARVCSNYLATDRLQKGVQRNMPAAGAGQQYQPASQPHNQPSSQPPFDWPTNQPPTQYTPHHAAAPPPAPQSMLVQAPPPQMMPRVAGSVFSKQAPLPQSVQLQPQGQMPQPHQMHRMDLRWAPVQAMSTFPPPVMHQPQLLPPRPPLPHSARLLIGNFHSPNFVHPERMHGTGSRGMHHLPPRPN